MLGTLRRTISIKRLETRRRKLESQRDGMLRSLMHGDEAGLYRHEYPNTPVLEDLLTELDYVGQALDMHRVALGGQDPRMALA